MSPGTDSPILTFIEQAVARKGYPSSMREIGAGVYLRSTSSVAYQLMALEKKCVPYRDAHRPRAYRVRRGRAPDQFGTAREAVQVLLVGRIAAGAPILAEEVVEDVLPLPPRRRGRAVRADGRRDIVVAMLDGEATVKRLRRENGKVWLMPHNAGYAAIADDDAAILGKVVAVLRAL
ncbi:LexA family protein [Streptomyces nojiriensis]|uniref:LexA family protein n=1 Tax=Streptomyces nojiriensis TaxID=66374 RepID=UPI0035E0707E